MNRFQPFCFGRTLMRARTTSARRSACSAIRLLRTGCGRITNLNPENYLRVLAQTCCAVGNSSSFVRDAGYFGTPVVLVGGRQEGREFAEHVLTVRPREEEIVTAIQFQRQHGPYAPSDLYGDGYVADKIADALARLTPYRQKRLHYIYDSTRSRLGEHGCKY